MCLLNRSFAGACGHVRQEFEDQCDEASRRGWAKCPDEGCDFNDTALCNIKCKSCSNGDDAPPTSSTSSLSLPGHTVQQSSPVQYAEPFDTPFHEEFARDEHPEDAFERIMCETAHEAQTKPAVGDREFEDELRQVLAASVQEHETAASHDFEEQMTRAFAESAATFKHQANKDFDDDLAHALATSRTDGPSHQFQMHEGEEAAVARLLAESAADWEKMHNAGAIADDDDEQLQETLRQSRDSWHRSQWRDLGPQEDSECA
jgi:hypothetical protein